MPFADLTVVDVAGLAAAPQIAAFFADFGARVIKVEPPGGDPLRRLVDSKGVALNWKLVNRNKQCVTLDLTRPAGRRLLDLILERSDVLVCGHSAERLHRFGLDAPTLQERFPRLVTVNLTAYGTDGPWAARSGSGTLAEAAAGLAALTGAEGTPPGLSPVGLGDYLGVLEGIIAALLGLYAREASSPGTGETFDVAMYEPILDLLGTRIATAVREGTDPVRHGNRFPTMVPRNAYPTADGRWVALTAGTDGLVHRLFGLIGRPDLVEDPRFVTNRDRVEHADDLDAIIGEWIGARSCEQVVGECAAAGISLAAIDGVLDVAENPHFNARGSLERLEDPELGPVVLPVRRPDRGRAPRPVRRLGRALGADNEEVYGTWLGLSEEERAALAADGVI